MSDTPAIMWRNLLAEGTVTLLAGTEEPGFPLANAFIADPLRPARIAADATGTIRFQVDIAAVRAVGYGTAGYGIGPFGRWTVQGIVLGAARHDPAGWRTARLAWTVNGVPLTDYGWENKSWIVLLDPPIDADVLTFEITGLAAGQVVSIPALAAGAVLRMPALDLGFDPYTEESVGVDFRTESGRVYQALRYRRIRMKPRWSYIEETLWSWLDIVREEAIELRKAFWFAWAPLAAPHETYLVRHEPKMAEMPIVQPAFRSLQLDLVEVI